jgi:hypothetical protein
MLLTKCIDDDVGLVKGLKDEVQALKSRCDALEKNVKTLLSICDTHRRSLDSFRLEIVRYGIEQGTLDLSYEGDRLELEP